MSLEGLARNLPTDGLGSHTIELCDQIGKMKSSSRRISEPIEGVTERQEADLIMEKWPVSDASSLACFS